jgi:hypothetical protein
MTIGVSIEYAHARTWARLGERPDAHLWQLLRAGRRLPALLEAVRASPAAPYVSGIDARASVDDLELAFRQQFRLRVDELAQWAPDDWVAAIRFTRHLVDLPALVHLAAGDPALPWMSQDPELAPYSAPSTVERRAALLSGPLAAITDALVAPSAAPPSPRAETPPGLHPAVQAWAKHWRALWPHCSVDERSNLERLVCLVERHLLDFPVLSTTDATGARLALGERLSALMRRASAQPAALFAWLGLVALDLEQLRSLFALRALDEAGAF